MKKQFCILVVLVLANITVLSQPAEYGKIFEALGREDNLISAEFTTRAHLNTFTVTLQSSRDITEIFNDIEAKTGLSLIGVSYKMVNATIILELDNSGVGNIDLNFLKSIKVQDWRNSGEGDLVFTLEPSQLRVEVSTSNIEDLEHNLQLAEYNSLDFTGTIPHPNSSTSIFAKYLDGSQRNESEISAHTDEDLAMLSMFERVFNNVNVQMRGSELIYNFRGDLNHLDDVFEIPSGYGRSIKSIYFKIAEDMQTDYSVVLVVGISDNNKKIEIMRQIISSSFFPWFNETSPVGNAVLTGMETSFDNELKLFGMTNQSGLVFTEVFPIIREFRGIDYPFFTRGTYSDSKFGRVMNFTIKCSWSLGQ